MRLDFSFDTSGVATALAIRGNEPYSEHCPYLSLTLELLILSFRRCWFQCKLMRLVGFVGKYPEICCWFWCQPSPLISTLRNVDFNFSKVLISSFSSPLHIYTTIAADYLLAINNNTVLMLVRFM